MASGLNFNSERRLRERNVQLRIFDLEKIYQQECSGMADEGMSQGGVLLQPRTDAVSVPAGDAIIVRRPHFRLQEDSLFFLISKRPFAVLSPAEVNVWNALEKEATVAELGSRLGPQAAEAISRLVTLEVVEVLTPPPSSKRRRVMVIEPHMDDAALSIGGLMLQRRGECEFLLVTVATQSLASSYRGRDRDFFDVRTVSNLRKAESEIVARMLWGRHIPLDLREATLRYNPQNWTLDWFQRHEQAIYAYLEHAAGQGELELWTSTIAKVIEDHDPEEIWMPLGIGVHVDHQLTRHACLNILRTNPKLVEQRVVRFFQDVPYAANFPHHTAIVLQAMRDAGVKLEEERLDVTDVKQEKFHLLSVYLSQWKTDIIWKRVESCSKGVGGPAESFNELWYRVAAPPTKDIDMIDTSAMKGPIYRVVHDVAPWIGRNRNAGKICILLGAPIGRWADDFRYLLDRFPNAHFELHTQTKFAGHAEMLQSPRVEVRLGGDRRRWILGDALPTILGRRQPVVIIAGRGREKQGRWLARLGLFSDSVVAETMSDFVEALRYVGNRGE
jgi:LmbE family N-acetylglucosaminyl deacetylase